MKIRKAYKYRLKTKPEQESHFRQQAGCCRFVWNKALALQKERLDAGEKILRFAELCKCLTGWKKEEEAVWLAEAQSQTLQQTLKFLDQAIKEAFDKKNPKRFPRFKKKGKDIDSFRYPQGFKLDGNRVFLPKIGWVRFIKSREMEGTPRNVTVSRRGDHWYVSIQTEREIAEPVHPSSFSLGIDRLKCMVSLLNRHNIGQFTAKNSHDPFQKFKAHALLIVLYVPPNRRFRNLYTNLV